MPLPLILGAGAIIAGVTGVGAGVKGAKKMKNARDSMEVIQLEHNRNIEELEKQNKKTIVSMDKLGKLELDILQSFDEFSNIIEKIQNRPQFEINKKAGVTLPKYDNEELKTVSVGASVLLGGIGGATAGTAGGFAAAGATTSAVMVLGTASTGTAIASLSGVAATNATLATLGGGALAAGGGGMALGTAVLSGATLGVGLLVGGIIFNLSGGKLSEKTDEARKQMVDAKNTMEKIGGYLEDLNLTAERYTKSLKIVRREYDENFRYVSYNVTNLGKTDWNFFTEEEKLALQNTVLLVGMLYKMCQVNLVNKAEDESELNSINKDDIEKTIEESNCVIDDLAFSNPINRIVKDSKKGISTDSENDTKDITVLDIQKETNFNYSWSEAKQALDLKDNLVEAVDYLEFYFRKQEE